MKSLNIFRDTELVGSLARVGSRDMSFCYDVSYLGSDLAQPISLSLPLQKEPFDKRLSRAWFANLLPEGEIRGHVARKLGVSERNDFDILAGIGGECAGALRVLPETASPNDKVDWMALPWDELEAAIASVPRPSLLALMMQEGELRLSLAGAQDKLPVRFAEGKLALPLGAAASTHLLKIANEGYPDLVQNEFFCLTLAREAGLPAPVAEMAATETPILLVERYDRRPGPGGIITRLHQEDFCQALGAPPESKYENEGGPSLKAIFEALVRGSRSPLPDKRDLLHWVLFNFIIGNADAHAKNVSLLYGETRETAGPRLAPFYDLVCTEVYGGLSSKMAQKIGGEYRPDHLARRHWKLFAEAIGINFKYLCSVGLELCDKVQAMAPSLAAEIGNSTSAADTLGKTAEVIGKRIDRLREGFHD
jgi:serine/threonine-protein kinase HipA